MASSTPAPAGAERGAGASAASAAAASGANGAQGANGTNGAHGAYEGAARTSTSAPPRAPSGLLQSITALWQELPGLVSDRVELLSLELKRAGAALAQIVVLGVVAALLGLTAWVLLWGAIVSGLVALGLHVGLAMLVGLLLNGIAAAMVLARMKKQVGLLQLPATRRHLTVKAAVKPLKPSEPLHRASSDASPSTSSAASFAAASAANSAVNTAASSTASDPSANGAAKSSNGRLPERTA